MPIHLWETHLLWEGFGYDGVNLFSSAPRMKLVKQYGGIKEIFCLGTGRDIGFDIGFPFAAIHFQKKLQ